LHIRILGWLFLFKLGKEIIGHSRYAFHVPDREAQLFPPRSQEHPRIIEHRYNLTARLDTSAAGSRYGHPAFQVNPHAAT